MKTDATSHIVIEVDEYGEITSVYADKPDDLNVQIIYHDSHQWQKDFGEVRDIKTLDPHMADGYKFTR